MQRLKWIKNTDKQEFTVATDGLADTRKEGLAVGFTVGEEVGEPVGAVTIGIGSRFRVSRGALAIAVLFCTPI